MTENTPHLIWIDLYQSTRRKTLRRAQTWRWRAISGRNGRILANSADAYTNRSDAVSAIQQLFGSNSDVYQRQAETGDLMLRLANQPQT